MDKEKREEFILLLLVRKILWEGDMQIQGGSYNDVILPEYIGKKFNKKIKKADENISEIENKQREISSLVYSLSTSTHKILDKKVDSLSIDLRKCISSIETLHKILPLLILYPFSFIKESLHRIIKLELAAESTQEKINQLSLLLKNPEYLKSIISYKTTIEKYEEVCEKFNDIKRNNLTKIYQGISLDLNLQNDQARPVHIKIIHEAIFQFHQQAFISPELPKNQNKIEIVDQMNSITIKDPIPLRCSEEWIIVDPMNSLTIDDSTPLREDLTFCSGKWVIEQYFIKLANPSIKSQVERMEKIAKVLQYLQENIQKDLEKIYLGINVFDPENGCTILPDHFALLKAKKQELEETRQSLYPLLSTKDTSVGFNYAARLLAYIEQIKLTSRSFKKDFSINNKILSLLNKMYNFLSNEKDTDELYEIVKLSALNKEEIIEGSFNQRIFTSLQELTNKLFQKKIKHDEKSWFTIITGDWEQLNEGLLQEIGVRYIEKELIRQRFFKQPLQLDMAMCTLNTCETVQKILKEKFVNNLLLEQMYKDYLFTYDKKIIAALCKLFQLISSWRSHSIKNFSQSVFLFSQSIAQLYIIKKTLVVQILKKR